MINPAGRASPEAVAFLAGRADERDAHSPMLFGLIVSIVAVLRRADCSRGTRDARADLAGSSHVLAGDVGEEVAMPMQRDQYPSNWDEIALAIKEAAGWRCQECGMQCRRPGEIFDTHRRTLTCITSIMIRAIVI
jgi:hypothetical protein